MGKLNRVRLDVAESRGLPSQDPRRQENLVKSALRVKRASRILDRQSAGQPAASQTPRPRHRARVERKTSTKSKHDFGRGVDADGRRPDQQAFNAEVAALDQKLRELGGDLCDDKLNPRKYCYANYMNCWQKVTGKTWDFSSNDHEFPAKFGCTWNPDDHWVERWSESRRRRVRWDHTLPSDANPRDHWVNI